MPRLLATCLLAASFVISLEAGVAVATTPADSGIVFSHEYQDTVTVAYVNRETCESWRPVLQQRGLSPTECAETVYGGGVWWIGAPLGSWWLTYHV